MYSPAAFVNCSAPLTFAALPAAADERYGPATVRNSDVVAYPTQVPRPVRRASENPALRRQRSGEIGCLRTGRR